MREREREGEIRRKTALRKKYTHIGENVGVMARWPVGRWKPLASLLPPRYFGPLWRLFDRVIQSNFVRWILLRTHFTSSHYSKSLARSNMNDNGMKRTVLEWLKMLYNCKFQQLIPQIFAQVNKSNLSQFHNLICGFRLCFTLLNGSDPKTAYFAYFCG